MAGAEDNKTGGKWGFIDRKGNWLINPQFDAVSPFRNGLAQVTLGGIRGYINTAGKYVWLPK